MQHRKRQLKEAALQKNKGVAFPMLSRDLKYCIKIDIMIASKGRQKRKIGL